MAADIVHDCGTLLSSTSTLVVQLSAAVNVFELS